MSNFGANLYWRVEFVVISSPFLFIFMRVVIVFDNYWDLLLRIKTRHVELVFWLLFAFRMEPRVELTGEVVVYASFVVLLVCFLQPLGWEKVKAGVWC